MEFLRVHGLRHIDYGYDLMLTDFGNRYGINVGSSERRRTSVKIRQKRYCCVRKGYPDGRAEETEKS